MTNNSMIKGNYSKIDKENSSNIKHPLAHVQEGEK